MSDNNLTTQFSQEVIGKEEWKVIPMFNGIYSVSNLGRVKRNVGGPSTFAGKIYTPVLKRYGYHGVCLRVDDKNISILIHTLVAITFNGPRPKGFEVNHIDGNKNNNRPSNLEYVSHAANMHHGVKLGLFPRKTHCCKGHELSPENRYLRKDGYTQCLICRRESHRRADRKRRHPIYPT